MSMSEEIARALQLSVRYVRGVAGTASHRYKQFSIKKSDGLSMRLIEQPSKEVKLLQRWLVRRVFNQLPTHPAAHAYVKGRSIQTNALVHRKSRFISRLDLKNFFPSLRWMDISALLRRSPSLPDGTVLTDEDVQLICRITCRDGRLTIGAPSSPTISNKLMFDLDTKLMSLAESYRVNYTRYADDLYFSAFEPNVLQAVCDRAERILADCDSPTLRINERKTYHASRKRRMVVTGIRITPDEALSVGRDLKRKVRVLAHKASVNKIQLEDLEWLRGMLAYIHSIEPEFSEKIQARYNIH